MKFKESLVELRKFPYPYKACLSICSDIDCTDTYEKFIEIQSFISERIGIKFTNTFFPFHDENKFSLFSSREEDKQVIIENIKKGAIDAIHSYGEKRDFKRKDAEKAIEKLKQSGCYLEIWIDHAESKSNFCKYRFFGKGDIPGTEQYHFDLTKNYGIKFIWTERLTNIVGQDVPFSINSLLHIYDRGYPFYSLLSMAKTVVKILLSICGYKKYDSFKNNALVKIATMRDNQKLYEFIRFNNYYKGPSKGDSFKELHYLISDRVLNRLKKVEGYSIVYVHMGKNFQLDSIAGREAVAALRNLKQEFENGNIYVDYTSKILKYYITHKFLKWSSETKDAVCHIYIDAIDDPLDGVYVPTQEQLENITFYVPYSRKVQLFIDGQEVKSIRYNPRDYTKRESITILKN